LELHLKTVSKTLDRGAGVLNAVAPMPSLHAGMALLVALWFFRNCRTWIRILALAYPITMLTALVYFGEHFIIDGLAGWAVVLLAWFLANKWEERTSRLRVNSRTE
jgi:membrane-associated phospholipid phosphatase